MSEVRKIKVRFKNQAKYPISKSDADKWITVHPNGSGSTGTPALIGENGEVKGGMGGKFNGKNIKDAHGTKNFTSRETNAETESRNQQKSATPENKSSPPVDSGANKPHNPHIDNKTSEGSKMKYTITQSEWNGATYFKVHNESGKMVAMPSTREEAEALVAQWSPLEEVNPEATAFEFTSEMYGGSGKKYKEKGNSERDEDRRFGL
jgi:hypothetical protein